MPFVTPNKVPWQLPDNVFQFWCRFNTAKYKDDLYSQLNIPFPQSLENAVAKRKAEHLAGRYCAHNALYALRQEKCPAVGIGLHGSPQWPPGIKGSISHSQTWACALVSEDPNIRGIGVDIEKIVDANMVDQSRELVLVAEELPLLEQKNIDRNFAFTLIFSVKESFFKAVYPSLGEYLDFDAITVTHIDSKEQTVGFQVKESLHSQLSGGAVFKASYRWLKAEILATSVVSINESL